MSGPLLRRRSASSPSLPRSPASAGCSSADSYGGFRDAGPPAGSRRSDTLTWLFTERALHQVIADADVRAKLEQSRIFELARFARPPDRRPGLVPTVKFASYATMRDTLAAGGLAPWVKAILYDNEALAVHARSRTARAGDLWLRPPHWRITATTFCSWPARRSTWPACCDRRSSTRAAACWARAWPGRRQKVADVVNIQAELGRSTSAYVQFVREATAQARRARPGITVLAGISSNPTGPKVTAAQLSAAMVGDPAVRRRRYWIEHPIPWAAVSTMQPVAPRPGDCGHPLPVALKLDVKGAGHRPTVTSALIPGSTCGDGCCRTNRTS